MDSESDNSWGLNSSFNITSLDPQIYYIIESVVKFKTNIKISKMDTESDKQTTVEDWILCLI